MSPEFLQGKSGVCRKRTDRTCSSSSYACHVERSGFFRKETLPEKDYPGQ
jgi:hypothetical protein